MMLALSTHLESSQIFPSDYKTGLQDEVHGGEGKTIVTRPHLYPFRQPQNTHQKVSPIQHCYLPCHRIDANLGVGMLGGVKALYAVLLAPVLGGGGGEE